MTVSDVLRLFAFIELIDPRIAGDEPKARAWMTLLDENMDYESAIAAVKRHYTNSVLCVMPAHLNQIFILYGQTSYFPPESWSLDDANAVPMPDNVRALIGGAFKKVPNDYE